MLLLLVDSVVTDVDLAWRVAFVAGEVTAVETDVVKLDVDISGGAAEATVEGSFLGPGLHAYLDW